MRSADVAVVGGGPAGAAAAVALARAGRDVVVVDKARFPRDKCCGDGLTTSALRSLEALGLRPADVASWRAVDDVRLRAPSGRVTALALPGGAGTYAAVARRTDLDAALLGLARAAGAEVHEGAGLLGATATAEGVALDVDGLGVLSARYAIGADGAWSPLRKALGVAPPKYLGEWHAFRAYAAGVGPEADGALWVWFDPDLLPGYAWSFPLPDGRANVGFGLRRRPGETVRAMAATWRGLLERPHVRAVLGPGARLEGPHRAWPIPAALATGRSVLSAGGGRALFAGDAAAACDPLTGEGIGQALETGTAAARAILAAGPDRPGRAAAGYRDELARSMAVDHRLAERLSGLLSHPRVVRGALRLAGATDWSATNFARWMFEDEPRAVLATPRRWHRGLLAGPGAYRDQEV